MLNIFIKILVSSLNDTNWNLLFGQVSQKVNLERGWCNIFTSHIGTKRKKLLQQSLFSCCVASLQAVKIPKSDIPLDSARGFIRNEKHGVKHSPTTLRITRQPVVWLVVYA